MGQVGGRRKILEPRMMRNVVGGGSAIGGARRARPLAAGGAVGVGDAEIEAPINAPQETPLAFNRSPMFLPPSRTVSPREQTSPVGSRSPISVPGPALFGTTFGVGAEGVVG